MKIGKVDFVFLLLYLYCPTFCLVQVYEFVLCLWLILISFSCFFPSCAVLPLYRLGKRLGSPQHSVGSAIFLLRCIGHRRLLWANFILGVQLYLIITSLIAEEEFVQALLRFFL